MKYNNSQPPLIKKYCRSTEVLQQIAWFLFFCAVSCLIFYRVVFTRELSIFTGWDNTVQSVAWYNKLWNAFHAGELPLWDFNTYSGVSLIGEFQPGVLYPLNFLYCMLVPEVSSYSLDLLVVLHFAMAAYFMFCYLRDFQRSCAASVFGGITFAFIGAAASRAYGQSNIFMAVIWLPLAMLFLKRTYDHAHQKRQCRLYILLTGTALGLSILAGHLQPYVHIVICMALYTLFSVTGIPDFWKKLKLLIGCGIISVLVAFGQIVAGLEYLSRSYRWVSLDNPVKGLSALPRAAYDLFLLTYRQFPSLMDATVTGDDGGTLFIGIAALILALVALRFWREKGTPFHIVLLAVSILIAAGSQTLIGLLLYRLPGLSTVREPIRVLMLYDFAAAFLAAQGFDLLIGWLRCRTEYAPNLLKQCLCPAVCVILCLESMYAADSFNALHLSPRNSGYDPDTSYQQTEAVQFLEQTNQSGIYRFANINNEAVTPNLSDKYTNLFSTRGHRATMPINYFDYLCRDWSETSGSYSFLGVKYLISREPLDKPEVTQVYADDSVYIYENPDENISIFHMQDESGMHSANVTRTEWHTNSVTVDVTAEANGTFVFSQADFPGWKAYVDGQRCDLVDYDVFNAVFLTQGSHTVHFQYAPWWLPAWGISLVLCTVYLAFTFTKKKEERK